MNLPPHIQELKKQFDNSTQGSENQVNLANKICEWIKTFSMGVGVLTAVEIDKFTPFQKVYVVREFFKS